MAALGIGVIWVGYSLGLYGYCLLKGYDVTPKQLFSQIWPPPIVSGEAVGAGAGIAAKGGQQAAQGD